MRGGERCEAADLPCQAVVSRHSLRHSSWHNPYKNLESGTVHDGVMYIGTTTVLHTNAMRASASGHDLDV